MIGFSAPLQLSEAELLERLSGLPGAFFLRDGDLCYFGAFPERGSDQLIPLEPSTSFFAEHDVPVWVGALPYEAFRSLERKQGVFGDSRSPPHLVAPVWCRYPAVGRLAAGRAELFAETESSLARLSEALHRQSFASGARPRLIPLGHGESRERHVERIKYALREIEQGNLYQVNLARRFRFATEGSALELLTGMGVLGRAQYSAAVSFGSLSIVSSSPELFLSITRDGRIETRPIKGTRPRGRSPAEDLALRVELDASEKERAELAMVIDLERNDLGRVCLSGSVHVTELPHVTSHPTVHHREATVVGQLRPDIPIADVLRAMSPSGSVTGAPKVSAMDCIAALEAERRGLYTGSLGYLTRNGTLRLSMAIRVLTIQGGEAHYFAGGGIVADSDPELEVAETEWKAEQLRSLITS